MVNRNGGTAFVCDPHIDVQDPVEPVSVYPQLQFGLRGMFRGHAKDATDYGGDCCPWSEPICHALMLAARRKPRRLRADTEAR